MELSTIRSDILAFLTEQVDDTNIPICSDILPETASQGGIVYRIDRSDFQQGIEGKSQLTTISVSVTVGRLTRTATDNLVDLLRDVPFRYTQGCIKYITCTDIKDIPYDPNTDVFFCSSLNFTAIIDEVSNGD